MTQDILYRQLQRLGFRNPEYKQPQGHSTFIVIELAESEDSVHFSSTVVDPTMPTSGKAEDYLNLLPMQRVALEIGDITHILLDGLSSVAIHGPDDETVSEKLDGDKNAIVKCLRWLSRRAAIQALQLATESKGSA